MASNKYNENSLGNGAGISKSVLKITAITPKKKKRIGGVKTF